MANYWQKRRDDLGLSPSDYSSQATTTSDTSAPSSYWQKKRDKLNVAKRKQPNIPTIERIHEILADRNSEWEKLSKNEDFLEKSGYVSTKSGGIWDKLISQYGMGYNDLQYEYINNQNGIRDEIAQKARSFGADTGKTTSPYEEKSLGYMTDKEVAVYNYYYQTEGKERAQAYLDSIQEGLNTRKAESMFSVVEGNTGKEVLSGVLVGLDQHESGLKNAFNTEDDYIPQTSYQILSGKVSTDLEDVGPNLPDWLGGKSLGQVGYDAVTTTSNMAPSVLISTIPGFGQVAGTAMMGVSAAGNAYQQALNEGYDKKQARLYSTLIGASEALLQKAIGGIGKLGGTSATITRAVSGIDNGLLRFALEYGGKIGSEALEEGLQEILDPLFKNAVMGTDEKVDWANVSYSALLGGLMGAGYGASEVAGSHLSNAETSVVNKEFNDRVAEREQNGKKLTSKQKNKIYDDVIRDMEKGRISTDTIEEVLGGETYKSYKDAADSEDAIKKEFDTLNKMKQGDMTGEQIDRRTELKAQLETIQKEGKRDQLRAKLGEEVFGLVKGDRLAESYNERSRRGQAFDADLSKYDAKQQAVIKKAVDSGILNNTNRTHEFVDMIAKISADKGVLFDFTNNAKLKETGFALDGKTVNGYVTKDGVTININSAKALNSVVGHEITHVLEGTEFYAELQKAIFDYAKPKGEYLPRYNALKELYKDVYKDLSAEEYEAKINAEVTSDLIGDLVFTDADFVNRLSTENRNVFQKLYDEIKYICRVAAAGSKEAKQLEKAKKIFEDAFRAEAKNTVTEDGVRYSLGQQSATNTQSQYAYMKPFADQLADYQKGNINVDDALVVGATPDVLKEIGLVSLPMTINQKHVGDALNGTYKGTQQEKLDHTFTAQELATLPEKLADPVAIIYDKRTGKASASESNIDVLVEMTVASGKQVLAAVQINGNGRINGIRIDTNKVATVHGNTDSVTRLVDAINENQKGNVTVFYLNNKKTTKVLQRTGNPIPSGLSNLDGFIHSITDPGSPVKMRLSSVTESQQFKWWFGDWQNHPENASKVVNDDGTPKVVYHGTNATFNVFQSQSGEYWFSEYEDYAESMMEERGGGEVKSVYLNMRNPYRAKLSPGQFTDPTYEAPILRNAKEAGHDGVIIENDTTDPLAAETFYVVFNPEQIKSATDNVGTFDAGNPDIRYSMSNDGEHIAPYGNYNVSGKDIALDIAPVGENVAVQRETQLGEDIAPVRDDIEPIDVANSPVLKRMNAKLENSKAELAKNEQLRAESKASFDEKIAKAQAQLDAKKNKDTKVANALSRRIERLQRLKADVDASYAKRIGDIKSRIVRAENDIGNYHPGLDRAEKAIARINRELEADKAELTEEYNQKVEQLKDKDAYISQQATELYNEIRSLKKGVKASEQLGYLLDHGYEWSAIKAALVNIKHTPGRTVNVNSPIEGFAREMLNESYETAREDLDAEYLKKTTDLEAAAEQKRQNARVANQRKAKQNEYAQQMADLIGDTTTWVDKKMGWQYEVNTLKRNLRDVIRDGSGKRDIAKADAIWNELQGKYNQHEAMLNRESNRIKKPYADLSITKAEDAYIQMLGELRHNPDTTLTTVDVDEFYEAHKNSIDKEKVDKAIEMARGDYDSLFERVNEVLREQGMKEIPYRKGYFPHFTEDKQGILGKLFKWKVNKNQIPTDIAGLTEQFNPTRSWQSFNKQRKSDTTDYSFQKGLDGYVQGALDWIYHIEDIQKRRAFENHIRYVHSEKGTQDKIDAIRASNEYDADEAQAQIEMVLKEAGNPLNNFVTDFRTGTNLLAGKKNSLDRGVEQQWGREIYSVVSNVSNRVSANYVAGSISSALTNFIPITQSWGEVSPVSSLRAMGDTIRAVAQDDGVIEKSDFLTNRLRPAENLHQTGWDKAGKVLGGMMEAIDSFTSQTVWRSKYLENIANGMSENAAIQNADQFAAGVMADRSRGNMPTIFDSKNPITKIFTAFQLEVTNQYGYMLKDMPQDMRNESVWKLAKGYTTMFVGAYAYNALYSKLTGRDAAFDPIGIIEDLLRDLGWIGDDEEEEPVDILMNLTENVLEEVPFVGGLMGGGRIPISSALPYDGNFMDFVEGTGKLVLERDTKQLTEWLNPVYYLAMPMGGGQLKKTIQGLKMFDDDFPIAGSYTNNGNLRYAVEDTVGNRVQAALFGQYANENARNYFDNDRKALEQKQIQEFAALDITMEDYWAYQDEAKKIAERAESENASDEDILKSKYLNSVNSELSKIIAAQEDAMENPLLSDKLKQAEVEHLQKQFDELARERYESFNNVSIKGNYANIGSEYYQWYTPENGEAYWRKLDDDQALKYRVTSKAGNTTYATNGKVHYRLEEGGDWRNISDWAKINDKQLARQKEVTKALGITPEEYWSKTEISYMPMSDGEYEYAFDNPDNYAVAKAVGGYDAYTKYSQDLYNIKADKDKNGKSISGSRQDKVLDYINNLDADYYTKLILYKSAYNSYDAQNDEILEYLNGRTDLTYQEKVSILKKLGANVDSEGKIKW